uniref:Uncharacterized protein n=1 Tax=Mycena chlorophos TaxID=658473 RepID=A0ABQ0KY54_MYCCL|nr:predicted protein [Mycena chlorophos]
MKFTTLFFAAAAALPIALGLPAADTTSSGGPSIVEPLSTFSLSTSGVGLPSLSFHPVSVSGSGSDISIIQSTGSSSGAIQTPTLSPIIPPISGTSLGSSSSLPTSSTGSSTSSAPSTSTTGAASALSVAKGVTIGASLFIGAMLM